MELHKQHKSKAVGPPVWEEWGMFHKGKGCPDDELDWCFLYEYWREWVQQFQSRGSVAQWRKKFNEGYRIWLDDFKSFGVAAPQSEREGREYRFTMLDKAGAPSGFPFEIFNDFPEFPELPWLNIPLKTRKNRLKSIRGDLSKMIEGSVYELRLTPDRYVNKVTTKGPFDGEVTWCVFGICWEWGIDTIKAAFDTWLTKNKPKTPKPPVEFRAALKQLGALRLMKVMKPCSDQPSEPNACGYTMGFLKDTHGIEYPLFADEPSAWRRARSSARKRLRQLGPRT